MTTEPAKYIRQSAFLATPEVRDERRAVCAACPHLINTLSVARCGLCGCPIATRTLPTKSSCPDQRWNQ